VTDDASKTVASDIVPKSFFVSIEMKKAHDEQRIGRVLIAQGRDAADVPITQTFGPNTLVSFKVWTDELV
jgi:hypothetical protein